MASSVKPFDASEPLFGAIDAATAASLLAVAGDIALVIDSAGVIRDVATSEGESPIHGTRSWIGRPWADTVTSDTRLKIETLIREAVNGGISKRRQVNHAVSSGVDVPVAYTAVRIGRAGGLVAVGRDMRHVSALQQRLVEAQQAMERDYWRLRHVETRYRLLFQLASDGILVVDGSNLKVLDATLGLGADLWRILRSADWPFLSVWAHLRQSACRRGAGHQRAKLRSGRRRHDHHRRRSSAVSCVRVLLPAGSRHAAAGASVTRRCHHRR